MCLVNNEIKRLINKYGKEHESLIRESITWLEKDEKNWNLKVPMNKDKYIEYLLESIVKDE